MPPGGDASVPGGEGALSEVVAERDAPGPDGLMRHGDASFQQQFLNIPIAEGEPVGQPNRVMDDHHRETVAVQFRVRHSELAYPDKVRATQPSQTT